MNYYYFSNNSTAVLHSNICTVCKDFNADAASCVFFLTVFLKNKTSSSLLNFHSLRLMITVPFIPARTFIPCYSPRQISVTTAVGPFPYQHSRLLQLTHFGCAHNLGNTNLTESKMQCLLEYIIWNYSSYFY